MGSLIMKKIVASNLMLVANMPEGMTEEEALNEIITSINASCQYSARGLDIKLRQTEETDTYEWEPDKKD